MERTNEKSIELTTNELDTATGGMAPRTLPTHLPPVTASSSFSVNSIDFSFARSMLLLLLLSRCNIASV